MKEVLIMKKLKHLDLPSRSRSHGSVKINTTLFDLLDAINEEVKEEELVVRIVSDWIDAGHLKFIDAPKRNKRQWLAEAPSHP